LASAYPSAEARQESHRLIGGLQAALPGGGLRRVRAILAQALRRWRRRGLDAETAVRAVFRLFSAVTFRERARLPAEEYAILRAHLDGLSFPLVAVNSRLRVIVCNRAFEALAPERHARLYGKRLEELLAPGHGHDLIEKLRAGHCDDEAVQIARASLTAVSGCEYLVSWMRYSPPGRQAGWLLRLASGGGDALEALGERVNREKSQKEKYASLLTVSNAVVDSLELDRILDTIAREARKVIQADECTVFKLDEAQGVLVPAGCDVQEFRDEVMAIRLPLGQGITGDVALTGRGRIVNDALSDPQAVQVPGTPVEQSALLCVPLWMRERVAGAITLARVGNRVFQDEDLELATLFASQCSAAIANAQLYEETRHAYNELREAQAQLVQSAKLNALGEMAGGVAHDFNNILAAILGRTQLMLQGVSHPDQRRQLEVIEQAALDGAQAVRRVQEFTRLRQDEQFQTLDPERVLVDVLELTRPAWEAESKRRGIALSASLDLQATQSVAGNASELREVFTNIILNAIDAMPWGGTLGLSSADVGEGVCVRVSDTGVGMDADTSCHVFDPFFTTKPVKGTGLGLSVAYGIVTRHRGRIEVESQLGRGTTFSVWLPASRAGVRRKETDRSEALPRLRALVVDDEEPVLQVLRDLLTLLGQDVEVVLGGAEGIERFSCGRFDVVFTDLGMPEVNGWEVARAVKSRSPATPVVIVTGWGAQVESQALHARGADLVVAKPFSLEDLRDVLRRVADSPARAA
jgi:signal transduction histidine kinase/ActR/RegA family two-component response regulator